MASAVDSRRRSKARDAAGGGEDRRGGGGWTSRRLAGRACICCSRLFSGGFGASCNTRGGRARPGDRYQLEVPKQEDQPVKVFAVLRKLARELVQRSGAVEVVDDASFLRRERQILDRHASFHLGHRA